MRFMLIVEADKNSEAGVLPDKKRLADRGNNVASTRYQRRLTRFAR